jgi:hypothetical protein
MEAMARNGGEGPSGGGGLSRSIRKFSERVQRLLGDMPHGTVDLLHRFLTQEGGRLSKRARENEFSMLTEEEGDAVEELWSECHERSE